jgi:AbrB family looped-hinge helix DNA binding protein
MPLFFNMQTETQINASGRIVIPKALRKQFGLDAGRRVRLISGPEGLTIVP